MSKKEKGKKKSALAMNIDLGFPIQKENIRPFLEYFKRKGYLEDVTPEEIIQQIPECQEYYFKISCVNGGSTEGDLEKRVETKEIPEGKVLPLGSAEEKSEETTDRPLKFLTLANISRKLGLSANALYRHRPKFEEYKKIVGGEILYNVRGVAKKILGIETYIHKSTIEGAKKILGEKDRKDSPIKGSEGKLENVYRRKVMPSSYIDLIRQHLSSFKPGETYQGKEILQAIGKKVNGPTMRVFIKTGIVKSKEDCVSGKEIADFLSNYQLPPQPTPTAPTSPQAPENPTINYAPEDKVLELMHSLPHLKKADRGFLEYLVGEKILVTDKNGEYDLADIEAKRSKIQLQFGIYDSSQREAARNKPKYIHAIDAIHIEEKILDRKRVNYFKLLQDVSGQGIVNSKKEGTETLYEESSLWANQAEIRRLGEKYLLPKEKRKKEFINPAAEKPRKIGDKIKITDDKLAEQVKERINYHHVSLNMNFIDWMRKKRYYPCLKNPQDPDFLLPDTDKLREYAKAYINEEQQYNAGANKLT